MDQCFHNCVKQHANSELQRFVTMLDFGQTPPRLDQRGAWQCSREPAVQTQGKILAPSSDALCY